MTMESQGTEPEAPAEDQLRQQIDHTRAQLGETVEQLAAKTDVQARTRARAAELASQARGTVQRARVAAVAQADHARGQLEAQPAGWRIPLVAAGAAILALLAIRKGRKRS